MLNQSNLFLNTKLKQYTILFFLWLVILIAFFLSRSVILPFLLALLLAYVLEPMVSTLVSVKFKKYHLSRGLSVLLIYFIIACIFFFLGAFFIPQVYHEIIKLAKEITAFVNAIDENTINAFGLKLENFFRYYELPLEIVTPDTPPKPGWISLDLMSLYQTTLQDILLYIKSETKNIIISMQGFIANTVNSLFLFFLTLMIAAFVLIDIKRIKGYLFTLVPKEGHPKFAIFLERLDQRLAGVVRGQLIICVVNAVLTLIGLLIFDIKFALILATTAGILSLVPIFGSIISTIPIVLVALTQSLQSAVFSLLWIIGIHALEANFLNPKIMGDSAKIHPVLVILSLLIGEHYYGIIGALLAVPIFSVLITAFNSLANLASSDDKTVAKLAKPDKI